MTAWFANRTQTGHPHLEGFCNNVRKQPLSGWLGIFERLFQTGHLGADPATKYLINSPTGSPTNRTNTLAKEPLTNDTVSHTEVGFCVCGELGGHNVLLYKILNSSVFSIELTVSGRNTIAKSY